MKYVIRHESAHTMRVHMGGYRMSMDQADILEYYLKEHGLAAADFARFANG